MYEQLKVKINERRKIFFQLENTTAATTDAPGWVSLTAGGLARFIAVTLVSPLELTRYIFRHWFIYWQGRTKTKVKCYFDTVVFCRDLKEG